MKPSAIGWSLAAALFGLALIAALFYLTGVTLDSLAGLMDRLNMAGFAGIVICTWLYVVLGAIKWRLITGKPEPCKFFYSHFTAQALLIGQFLPPPVAIATSRAAVMKFKQKTPLKHGFFNAVYDMGFDFLIALLFVPVSFLQYFYGFHFIVWFLLGLVIIMAAGFFAVYIAGLIPPRWLTKIGFENSRKHNLLAPRLIIGLIGLSAARFVLVIIRLALGAAAIGITVPLAAIAYAAPPATMSSLLFLTPANLGIAEWNWAWLLTLWGVPLAIGTLYGTGFRILVFFAQLIVSGFFWLLYFAETRKVQS
jgi:hypothetical protein